MGVCQKLDDLRHQANIEIDIESYDILDDFFCREVLQGSFAGKFCRDVCRDVCRRNVIHPLPRPMSSPKTPDSM